MNRGILPRVMLLLTFFFIVLRVTLRRHLV